MTPVTISFAGSARSMPGGERDRVERAHQAADDQLVAARGEQQREGGHLEQPGELGAVDHRLRVERLRQLEAAEQVDEAARRLDGREHQEDEEAEGRADRELPHQVEQERAGVAGAGSRQPTRGATATASPIASIPLICAGNAVVRERRRDHQERDHAQRGQRDRLDRAQVDGDVHQPPPSSCGIFSNSTWVNGDQLGDHPVPADDQRHRDRRRLRHERERDLLDLRDRLHQRDREADDERGDHDRARPASP